MREFFEFLANWFSLLMKCLIKSVDGNFTEESRSEVLGTDELFMEIMKNFCEKVWSVVWGNIKQASHKFFMSDF